MKVLLASSEVHPYSKTGGLADMAGALGKALAHAGLQVGLVGQTEYDGARTVLSAAAWTYVAGFLSSLLQLLYFVFLLMGSRRDD